MFDLALEKTFNSAVDNPIVPGTDVTFNIEVTNQGTLDAYNVKLKDYFIIGELILNDISWTEISPGVAEANNVIPFIGIGESVTTTVTFTVDPSFMGTTIVNYSEISEADDDNDPNNGFADDADSTPDDNQGDDELANDGETSR